MSSIDDRLRVVLVAIPLMARSGVYRSVHDLTEAARQAGLDWTAILGVRPEAPGAEVTTPGVREFTFADHGLGSIKKIREIIETAPEVGAADVLITLIPQSDMAVSWSPLREKLAWIAWVRGKPWPDTREQSLRRRVPLQLLETRALRRADDVWSTSAVLASQFASARDAFVVPAGIAAVPRRHWGTDANAPLIWAGRVDLNKRVELFIDIARRTGRKARVFGDGDQVAIMAPTSPSNLEWAGWASADRLWEDASIFVGTSHREAFGRSAVEAAMAGVPILIGESYGAAPVLVTDPELQRHCVMRSEDPALWAAAVEAILGDTELRRRISDHVHDNASRLTIDASVQAVHRRILELRASSECP